MKQGERQQGQQCGMLSREHCGTRRGGGRTSSPLLLPPLLRLAMLLLLLLCRASDAQGAALDDNEFLSHLRLQRRRLLGAAAPGDVPGSECEGKRPGDRVDGQVIVVFNPNVGSVDAGIEQLAAELTAPATTPAPAAAAKSAFVGAARTAAPAAAAPATTPAPPFGVVKRIGHSARAARGGRVKAAARGRVLLQEQEQEQPPPPADGPALAAAAAAAAAGDAAAGDAGAARPAAGAAAASAAAAAAAAAAPSPSPADAPASADQGPATADGALLGAVLSVPTGRQGAALVRRMARAQAVRVAAPDVCVSAFAGTSTTKGDAAGGAASSAYACIEAAQLSSVLPGDLAAGATWAGCVTPATQLVWWGERCGASFTQAQWAGVYAVNRTSGARVPGCVKARAQYKDSSDLDRADRAYWLGAACGVAPTAAPALPTRVCSDAYVDEATLPAAQQGCVARGAADVAATMALLHPVQGCGARRVVPMLYRGERCTSNAAGGSTLGLPSAGVRWLSAEPASPPPAGGGANASACALARRAGGSSTAAAEDALFNALWFGSCGVPPARADYLPRAECALPAPPPPPGPPGPPPPPPRRDPTTLAREVVVGDKQTVSAGVARIFAASPLDFNNGSLAVPQLGYATAVAIVDTGVDCDHPDLRVAASYTFVAAGGLTDKNPCADPNGHGTHLAGIVGARNNDFGVVGVLPGTPIVSLKVFRSDGYGVASDVLNALAWLTAGVGANGTTPNANGSTNAAALNVDVVNLSMGLTVTTITSGLGDALCAQVRALTDAGLVVVAAASNDNLPLNGVVPAACASALAVTALAQLDGSVSTDQLPAFYSNYLQPNVSGSPPPKVVLPPGKEKMTVAAPGGDRVVYINSTCPNRAYCQLAGTSQATPHVAAIAARCFAAGQCARGGDGAAVAAALVQRFADYNAQNPGYGYARDPSRSTDPTRFYGWLAYAGLY